jgi:hypothetical protein
MTSMRHMTVHFSMNWGDAVEVRVETEDDETPFTFIGSVEDAVIAVLGVIVQTCKGKRWRTAIAIFCDHSQRAYVAARALEPLLVERGGRCDVSRGLTA